MAVIDNLSVIERFVGRKNDLDRAESGSEGRVIKECEVWAEGDGGLAKPSLFAVRQDGSIAWEYVGQDYADRPTDDELFDSLRGGA